MRLITITLSLLLACKNAAADVSLIKHKETDSYSILVAGNIEEKTEDELKQMVQRMRKENIKLHMNMIRFNSNGGHLRAGMEIGRFIRSERLNTYVAPGDSCNSACVYAFIGGIERFAFGKFEVHNTTFIDGTESARREVMPNIIDKDIKRITDYVREQRLSIYLSSAILDTPAWTVKRLTDKEKNDWGVNGIDRTESDVQLLELGKVRGFKKGEMSKIFEQHFMECHQQVVHLKQSVWDCLRTRNYEMPHRVRIMKWIEQYLPKEWALN